MLHQVEIINIDPDDFVSVGLHDPLSEHVLFKDLALIIEEIVIWSIDLDSHLLVPDYHVAEHQVVWRVHCHLLLELEAMLRCVLI